MEHPRSSSRVSDALCVPFIHCVIQTSQQPCRGSFWDLFGLEGDLSKVTWPIS